MGQMVLTSNQGQRTPGTARFKDSKSLKPGQPLVWSSPYFDHWIILPKIPQIVRLNDSEPLRVENATFLEPLSSACKVYCTSSGHCNHDISYGKRVSIIWKLKQSTQIFHQHHADPTFPRLLQSIMQYSFGCEDAHIPNTPGHQIVAEFRPVIFTTRGNTRLRTWTSSKNHDQHFEPAGQ